MSIKTKKILVLFAALCVVSTGCSEAAKPENTPSPSQLSGAVSAVQPETTPLPTVSPTGFGDDIPVSRALAAKMIMLAYNDINNIDTMDREITFTDSDISKWYDKYINAAYIEQIMLGDGENFYPEEPLTVQQAVTLLDNMNPQNKTRIQLTDDNKNMPISYALWTELYRKQLESLCGGKTINEVFGIEAANVIVLATPGSNTKLRSWNMITDKGPFSYTGLNMEPYVDMELRIFYRDGEIVAVTALNERTPTIKNAYVVGGNSGGITIFSGGAERRYEYANTWGNVSGRICDIKINGQKALSISFTSDKTAGIIKKSSDDMIELEGDKIYAAMEDFKVYSLADGQVKWKKLSDLTIGTDIAEFYLKNGSICAAVITKKATAGNLRVAISTSGFSSLIHDSVSLTATTGYTVTAGGKTTNYNAGDILTISADENASLFDSPRIYVKCSSNTGRIQLKSVGRNWPGEDSPKYRGIIEIGKELNGYTIVNELSIEEYLYAVVPSEMPTSHGLEAAMVQAVTARSYAYNQYYANRYHQYGANIDDSVNSQVYNNIPENETSIKAVNDTAGICLTYNGSVISANFFSTSSGMTANSGEVWAQSTTKQFPTDSSGYLQAAKQYTGVDYGSLTIEANADAFFRAADIDSYDNAFSWFRWNVEMTAEEITASINANLKSRYDAAPALIKTMQNNGVFRSRPTTSIGALVDLEVTKRGEGGNIMEMIITGSEATILVKTEYNIRSLIRPYTYLPGGKDVVMNRNDGSTLYNYSIMPSAFYVIDKIYNDNGVLRSIAFYGGGNGHGSGMSQNGVKGMIDKGYTFQQILKHYYNGVEIKKML